MLFPPQRPEIDVNPSAARGTVERAGGGLVGLFSSMVAGDVYSPTAPEGHRGQAFRGRTLTRDVTPAPRADVTGRSGAVAPPLCGGPAQDAPVFAAGADCWTLFTLHSLTHV
jgi:hypothetical protein